MPLRGFRSKRNGKILSIAFHKRHNVGTLELYRRLKAGETVLALYQAHDTGQKVTLPLKSSPDIQAIFTRLRKA